MGTVGLNAELYAAQAAPQATVTLVQQCSQAKEGP